MKRLRAYLRQRMPLIVAMLVVISCMNIFIIAYRIIGLSRFNAVYAGFLTINVVLYFAIRWYIGTPQPIKFPQENTHVEETTPPARDRSEQA